MNDTVSQLNLAYLKQAEIVKECKEGARRAKSRVINREGTRSWRQLYLDNQND